MPNQLDRRRWLQRSTAALTTLPVIGFWSEFRGDEPLTPLQKLRIAAVGVGNRGASNLAAVSGEEIVGLCDVDQELMNPMSHRFPAARTFRDFRELLQLDNLDAVIISTPDHTHYLAAMLAMRRGLHVYCEKPLAHSVWEVRQMAAAAKQHKVVTQLGNHHHASEGYRCVAEIIRSGTIGAVREVHAWTNRPVWPQGIARPTDVQPVPDYLDWDLWLGPAPARRFHETYHPRGWRGWRDFGCGTLGDMGPHLLDPVFWALKLTYPTHIVAEHSACNVDTFPQSSRLQFTFPARDQLPPVELFWYDGERQPLPEVTGVAELPHNGVLFLGERAKLFAPDYGGPPIVMATKDGDTISLPKPFLPESPGHHAEWLRACKENQATSSDFEYAAQLTETCLLGNIATRVDKPLQWDAATARFMNHEPANQHLRREYRDGWKLS
jgi:predicted dehydrogenase